MESTITARIADEASCESGKSGFSDSQRNGWGFSCSFMQPYRASVSREPDAPDHIGSRFSFVAGPWSVNDFVSAAMLLVLPFKPVFNWANISSGT